MGQSRVSKDNNLKMDPNLILLRLDESKIEMKGISKRISMASGIVRTSYTLFEDEIKRTLIICDVKEYNSINSCGSFSFMINEDKIIKEGSKVVVHMNDQDYNFNRINTGDDTFYIQRNSIKWIVIENLSFD